MNLIDKSLHALAESVASILRANASKTEKRDAMAETFAQFKDHLKANTSRRIEEFDAEVERRRANPEYDAGAEARREEDEEENSRLADQQDDVVATEPILDPKLQSLVDALRVVNPQSSEADILHHVLNTGRGRALAQHFASITKKERPMPTIDKVLQDHTDFVKRHGIIPIAKNIVEKGRSPLSEHEFSALLMEAARRENEPVSKAFERLLQEPDVAKAHRIIVEGQFAKATLLNPVEVTPVIVTTGSSATADDSRAAYDALLEVAEGLRASGKYQTVAQAFAAAMEDTKNAELAARAHRRPNAA